MTADKPHRSDLEAGAENRQVPQPERDGAGNPGGDSPTRRIDPLIGEGVGEGAARDQWTIPLNDHRPGQGGQQPPRAEGGSGGTAEPGAGTPGGPGGPQAGDEKGGERPKRKQQGALALIRETAVLIVLAILLAVLFKTFLVQAFYIPSGSMEPTLNISDRVLVEKVSYRLRPVRDGDVIVFVHDLPGQAPESGNLVVRFFSSLGQAVGVAPPSDRDFIKRVVGTPGDRITCEQGKLVRNGKMVPEPYLAPGTTTENCTPTTVPQGKLYVMGDNRNNSEDSRTFGPVERSSVVGRAFVRIWPLSHTGWLRRDR
jgi:signal peptidase I